MFRELEMLQNDLTQNSLDLRIKLFTPPQHDNRSNATAPRK